MSEPIDGICGVVGGSASRRSVVPPNWLTTNLALGTYHSSAMRARGGTPVAVFAALAAGFGRELMVA